MALRRSHLAPALALAATFAGVAVCGTARAAQPVEPAAQAPGLLALVAQLDAPELAVREAATSALAVRDDLNLNQLEQVLTLPALSSEQRARTWLAARERFARSPRAAMGVQFNNGFVARGVMIAQVFAGFPAAGVLLPGDVIIAVAGRDLLPGESWLGFRPLIISRDPGDLLRMRVIRQERELTLDVPLGRFSDLPGSTLTPQEIAAAWSARTERWPLAGDGPVITPAGLAAAPPTQDDAGFVPIPGRPGEMVRRREFNIGGGQGVMEIRVLGAAGNVALSARARELELRRQAETSGQPTLAAGGQNRGPLGNAGNLAYARALDQLRLARADAARGLTPVLAPEALPIRPGPRFSEPAASDRVHAEYARIQQELETRLAQQEEALRMAADQGLPKAQRDLATARLLRIASELRQLERERDRLESLLRGSGGNPGGIFRP